jgi:hypothetical protein
MINEQAQPSFIVRLLTFPTQNLVNPQRSPREIFHPNNSPHRNDLQLFHWPKTVGIVVMPDLIKLRELVKIKRL